MNVSINLLHEKNDYKKWRDIAKISRTIVIVFGVMVLTTLLVIFLLRQNVKASIAELENKQDQLTKAIIKKQDKETRIILLNKKYEGMLRVVADDMPSLDYFNMLYNIAPQSTESVQIIQIRFDKTREADVVLEFANVAALSAFLSDVESDVFADSFSEIRYNTISFSEVVPGALSITLHVKFNTENQ